MQWTLNTCNLTASNSRVATSFSSLLWHGTWTALHLLSSPGLSLLCAYFLKMDWCFTLWACLAICLVSSWHEWTPMVFTFIRISLLFDFALLHVLFFCLCLFMVLSSLMFYCLHKHFLCSLHFQLLAQANICSLVISLVFLSVVNSHIITVIISSLFMSLIKCSFSHLSFLYIHTHLSIFSLYSHPVALILRWPIHSLAFLLCFLSNLLYWKDNIVLHCGLKFLLSTWNHMMLILYFSGSW